jgi:hypothetical protein
MSAWLALAAPPSAPQLNGQEKYFKSFDDIVDHCCYVWITLIDLSRGKIMSIARRDGQPGSGSAANASVGAGGAVEKFKTVSAPARRRCRFRNNQRWPAFVNPINGLLGHPR